MAKYIFISDLHLRAGPGLGLDLSVQNFLKFLDTVVSGAQQLYILGDFFDAWLGDDLLEDWVQVIITKMRQLSDAGTEIFFMPGNRDFLVGKALAQAAGFTLIPDPYRLSLGEQNFVLTHGDSLCTDDPWHIIYRAIIQHPVLKFIAIHLPRRMRNKIMQQLKARSRQHKMSLARSNFDVAPKAVVNLARKYRNCHIIHGHTHNPQLEKIDSLGIRRVVLGDWSESGAYYLSLDLNEIPEKLEFFRP